MKNPAPAFQFYASDYLCDEHVSAMTLEEQGAYVRALCVCWREETLPADPEILARVIGGGCSVDVAKTVLARFDPVERAFNERSTETERVHHWRLTEVLKEYAETREQNRQAGLASGRARRKQKETNSYDSNGRSTESEQPLNSSSSSSSSSSSNKNNKSASRRAALVPIFATVSDGQLRKALETWTEWRQNDKKKPVTPLALKQLLKRYANKPKELLEDLRYSVSQDWTGIFPEKKTFSKPTTFNQPEPSLNAATKKLIQLCKPKGITT
jgi:uncharacterized protein YdaU (DUF1376 family)